MFCQYAIDLQLLNCINRSDVSSFLNVHYFIQSFSVRFSAFCRSFDFKCTVRILLVLLTPITDLRTEHVFLNQTFLHYFKAKFLTFFWITCLSFMPIVMQNLLQKITLINLLYNIHFASWLLQFKTPTDNSYTCMHNSVRWIDNVRLCAICILDVGYHYSILFTVFFSSL